MLIFLGRTSKQISGMNFLSMLNLLPGPKLKGGKTRQVLFFWVFQPFLAVKILQFFVLRFFERGRNHFQMRIFFYQFFF